MAIAYVSISVPLNNIAFGNHRQTLLIVDLEPPTVVADYQAEKDLYGKAWYDTVWVDLQFHGLTPSQKPIAAG
jgi:hypothetical protein